MTKQKRHKGVKSLCKGGISMISHGIKGCGGRTEGHQVGKGQCRDGRLRGLKDLMGSKDYMSQGSRGSKRER